MKSIGEVLAQSGQVPVKVQRRENPPQPEAVVEAFRVANALKALAERVAAMPSSSREAVVRACAVVGVTLPEVKS